MDQHLDLDLGLGSLDRIELFAELETLRGVVLDDEAGGRVHTVRELVHALRDADSAGVTHSTAEVAPDSWAHVLSGSHDDLDQYLKRKPVFEWMMWSFLRSVRGLWSLVAGFQVRDAGQVPNKGAVIVCGNHASYLDPFLICMALPRHGLQRVFFVGYSEYFDGMIGRFLARLFRNIPIDANRNLQRAMQAAAEGLRRGMVLVIFPEGGRSLDGSVMEFRRGAAILARNLDVQITPVGIWGAHQVWPREGRIRRHPLVLSYGPTLSPGGSPSEEALLGELREEVIRLVDESSRAHDEASLN
jgi:long-chain acyl-CoA synthetase